jgi:hypothetical protein
MKKQSLIALAPMAIFAFAMSAMAEETAVVERTAEVSEILNAGAEKVQAAKKSQVTVDRYSGSNRWLAPRVQAGETSKLNL